MVVQCLLVFFLGWLFGLGFFIFLFHSTTLGELQQYSKVLGSNGRSPGNALVTPTQSFPRQGAGGQAAVQASIIVPPIVPVVAKTPSLDSQPQTPRNTHREGAVEDITTVNGMVRYINGAPRLQMALGPPRTLHQKAIHNAERRGEVVIEEEGSGDAEGGEGDSVQVDSHLYESTWIFFDWPYDDRKFTQENYKALETALNVYPNATFRVLLAGPNDAYVHKIGNQLSTTHFTKYTRRGYDLGILPVAMMPGVRPKVGMDYRQKWLMVCCRRCNGKCRNSDHVQPFHLLMYLRVTKLYRRGGIFSDFSWFLHGHLEEHVKNGYQILSHCSPESDVTMWQLEQSQNTPGKWVDSNCYTSVFMRFEPKSHLVMCFLKNYDDPAFLECVEDDEELGGAVCIKDAMDKCFESLGASNDLEALTEAFDKTGSGASKGLTTTTEWAVEPTVRLFWLGPKATSGFWPKVAFPPGSLIEAIVSQIDLRKLAFELPGSPCKTAHLCNSFNPRLGLLQDFRKSSYETGMEEVSCSPKVIVPGFMKAASTFLFSAISKHPQVLPPLKGAQMKETYCYHASPPRKLMKRMWCFPYVEPGEHFVTSDGTVYYATNPDVAYTLKEDNPNVKVVFAVRHPADRFYSNYKFSFDTYGKKGSIDDLINMGTGRKDKFGHLRELVLAGASSTEILNAYYNNTFHAGGALGVLFMHSINFPAIIHFQNVLGKENVMVVNSESLNTRNMTGVRNTLNDVFSFLGLCPYDIPDMDVALPGKNKMPEDKELSQWGYRRLNKFFTPFHKALADVTGWDLRHWDTREPKKSLPEKFNGLHDNPEKMWFE